MSVSPYEKLERESEQAMADGDVLRAISLLESAVNDAAGCRDLSTQGHLLHRIALLQRRSGDLILARTTLERALGILKDPDKRSAAEVLNDLGFVEREIGDLTLAQRRHEEALAIFAILKESAEMARALINLGVVQKDRGKLLEAQISFERALALLPNDARHARDLGHALTGLGLTCEILNRLDDARRYYQAALESYEQAEDRENEALTLHNLGKLHDKVEEFEIAVGYYRRSFNINQDSDLRLGMAEDLGAIAAILQVTGKPDEARKTHEKALTLFKAIGHRRGQISTLCDLGILARRFEQYDDAECYLTEALTLAEQMADPREIYEVRFLRAELRHVAGRLEEAAEDYRAATVVAEIIRSQLILEDDALAYFDEPRIEAYERLVLLYACNFQDLGGALRWVELVKGREFARRLRVTAISISSKVLLVLQEKETELLRQLENAVRALSVGDADHRKQALHDYHAVEKQLIAIWDEIELSDPDYVALRRVEPPTVGSIRGYLRAG